MTAARPGPAPATLRIRPATAGDLGSVLRIERASFGDPWSADSFRSLPDDERVCFAVAEERGRLVGYVVAWFVLDEAEIANIAVAVEARGRGIGRTLLEMAISEARGRGVRTVYLEVRESNAAARAMYVRRGFTELMRRRRYYRAPVEDAIVMRLALAMAGPEGK